MQLIYFVAAVIITFTDKQFDPEKRRGQFEERGIVCRNKETECHCSSGMELLGQTNTIRKTPCPNNHNEKIYGCCFSKTQNYASV